MDCLALHIAPEDSSQYLLGIEPPRISADVCRDDMWSTAISWVNENLPLVNALCSPYRQYLCQDWDDLVHLGYLLAFESLEKALDDGVLENFTKIFSSRLKIAARAMAAGPPLDRSVTLDNLPNLYLSEPTPLFAGLGWPTSLSVEFAERYAFIHMTSAQQKAWRLYLFENRGEPIKRILAQRNINRGNFFSRLTRGIDRVLQAACSEDRP